jgi:hypothetical protein
MRKPSQCGLCLSTRELQRSHLLPAALYRMLRQPAGGTDPNPVLITPSSSLTTSRQVSAPFLCTECEDRLSKNGERYVLAQCAQADGRFKLRELLETTSPLESSSQVRVYDAEPLLGEAIGQYLYFSASVFWRASAHNWYRESGTIDRFSLGAAYQEGFRQYLLGQTAFPGNARVWVHVSSEDLEEPLIVFPCTATVEGTRRHKFYIPSILFILFLGGQVPNRFDARALNGSRQRVMWVCPWEKDSLFRGVLNRIKASAPVGKLRTRVTKASG